MPAKLILAASCSEITPQVCMPSLYTFRMKGNVLCRYQGVLGALIAITTLGMPLLRRAFRWFGQISYRTKTASDGFA